VLAVTSATTNLFLGTISGTSVDGLDLALLEIEPDEPIRVLHSETATLPTRLQAQLLQLGRPEDDDLDLLGYCDSALGEFIGRSAIDFLTRVNIAPGDIRAIGSHGQTVRHRPPESNQQIGFTTQIGDPNRIAEITGITTVADFRRRDMAAGGHGAPLVPPFHQALFGHLDGNTVVLNIGGISNISILGHPPSGFDTGPGNGLMDNWSERHLQQPYDKGGAWAAQGSVDTELLAQLLSDPYFAATPPKSTGREYFNLSWLQGFSRTAGLTPEDVQATLCELTARCTRQALERWAPATSQLIVCGGGRLNNELMRRLAQDMPAQVHASERWQVDGDAIEAALFAWLASRTLRGLTGNEPAVTGAKGYRVLGAVYPA
jgi:anhydro-N-acetylmuramic acid kinase